MQVTRKMRLFTWADNETFFVKTLLSSVKGRYAEIPLLASLAASLAKYRPSLSVALADDLLEEVSLLSCKMRLPSVICQSRRFLASDVEGFQLHSNNQTTDLL